MGAEGGQLSAFTDDMTGETKVCESACLARLVGVGMHDASLYYRELWRDAVSRPQVLSWESLSGTRGGG